MKAKILVVDDSGLARRLLRKILEELGHDVEEADNGEQALERYALHRHDAVILDLLMHGMYGVDVLNKLRQLNPEARVIVATADIQKTTREQVLEAGAAALINKPVTRETMTEALNTALSGGSL
jgi:two-component system chemotaxis response regulator CheY